MLEEGTIGESKVSEFIEDLESKGNVAYIVYYVDATSEAYPECLITFRDYGIYNDEILDAILCNKLLLFGKYYTVRYENTSRRLQKLALRVKREHFTAEEVIDAVKKTYREEKARMIIERIKEVS